MTVVITLLNAGIDTGPFNLYSDLDGFVTAFETGVSRTSLLAGHASALVPDYTNFVRVQSTGSCSNYVDVPVTGAPATADISCGSDFYFGSGDFYPHTWTVNVGSELGWVFIDYIVNNRFMKIIALFDGNEVINSGYRGWAPTYPYSDAILNAAIVSKGDPPEDVVGYENGSLSFYKDTPTTTMTINIYSPTWA